MSLVCRNSFRATIEKLSGFNLIKTTYLSGYNLMFYRLLNVLSKIAQCID